jgi:hypothetical protein
MDDEETVTATVDHRTLTLQDENIRSVALY